MSAETVLSDLDSTTKLPTGAVSKIRASLYAQIAPAEILKRLKINAAQVRKELRDEVLDLTEQERLILSRNQKELIVQRILDDVLGYGPIEPLLKDPAVNEVMINGPDSVFVEKQGCLEQTRIAFEDHDHLMNMIDKIIAPLGRRVDESSPMVDGRLPDGSRVNVIIPPVALSGPTVTIRRFQNRRLSFKDLVDNGTIRQSAIGLLTQAIHGRKNIIVTGGTGSGKTTLLNALSSLIPESERIITIEDAAELSFDQPHVVRLESRPPNVEGRGRIALRDLVINALRMRPDRLVVGEVRGGETLDMLQAMNTGHDGSLTTAHANSTHEALSRLETMALMSGIELPAAAIRRQISSAFDLFLHMSRGADGIRQLAAIDKMDGLHGGEVRLTPVLSMGDLK